MDKKTILAFVGGGALVGGLVWMTSGPSAPSTPTEVVSEVREIPQENHQGQAEVFTAEADGTAKAKPASAAAPAAVTHRAPVAKASKPSPAAKPTPPTSPAPANRAPEPVASSRPEAIPELTAENPPSRPQRYDPEPAPAPVKKREPNKVTIGAGTAVNVRLGDRLSSETNVVGDVFQGTLDTPLVVDGFVIAEKGSRVDGKVASVDRSGRVRGVAEIHLELTQLHTADGQNVKITSDSFIKQAETSKASDAKKIGIGAGVGAAIGAIIGGGKGAAIGAGAGGAAGAGTVIATRGKEVELPVETKMTFHLGSAVTVTEKVD